jgi:hypothetical protein
VRSRAPQSEKRRAWEAPRSAGFLAVLAAALALLALVAQSALGAGAPLATTDPPSNLTQSNFCTPAASVSLTLNGTVNPNGADTSWYFEYGPTTSYGAQTPVQDVGSGTATVAVSWNLTGLNPSDLHYRLVASNADGPGVGQDQVQLVGVPGCQAGILLPPEPMITGRRSKAIRRCRAHHQPKSPARRHCIKRAWQLPR